MKTENTKNMRTAAALLFLVGCASPPSVAPLLSVAQRAAAEESKLLEQDALRLTAWIDQQRRALDDAYAADLKERKALDAPWVLTATQAYLAAREELVRHELRLRRESELRRENLAAVAHAVRRAAALLQQQDQLLGLIPDLRPVLTPTPIMETAP